MLSVSAWNATCCPYVLRSVSGQKEDRQRSRPQIECSARKGVTDRRKNCVASSSAHDNREQSIISANNNAVSSSSHSDEALHHTTGFQELSPVFVAASAHNERTRDLTRPPSKTPQDSGLSCRAPSSSRAAPAASSSPARLPPYDVMDSGIQAMPHLMEATGTLLSPIARAVNIQRRASGHTASAPEIGGSLESPSPKLRWIPGFLAFTLGLYIALYSAAWSGAFLIGHVSRGEAGKARAKVRSHNWRREKDSAQREGGAREAQRRRLTRRKLA